MSKNYNPVVDQGSDWRFSINYTENSLPVSLLGYTAKMQVREFVESSSPAFTLESKSATITAVSASAGTITYTAANSFSANQTVSIYSVLPTAYNLSNVKIKTANATSFTVENAATGTYVSGGIAMVGSGITIIPLEGKINVSVTSAQTTLLTAKQYVYDLKITSPQAEVTRIIQGTISVDDQVTRD